MTGTPQARLDEPFTRIASVRELESDSLTLLVLHQGERRIDRVDPSRGTRVQVGRNEAGPREYHVPTGMLAERDGPTLFMDARSPRALRIARDAATVADLTLPTTELGVAACLLRVDAAGAVLFRAIAANGLDRDSAAVIRFDLANLRLQILTHITSGLWITRAATGVVIGRPGFRPFEAGPVFGVLPTGELMELTPEPYRVRRLVNGSWVPSPLVPHSPVPVTAADRDHERVARQRAQPSGCGAAPPGRAPVEDFPDAVFPRKRPSYAGPSALSIAPNGDLWIARSQPYGDAAVTYDVLLPTVTCKSEVRLPPQRRSVGFGRNALHLVWQDPETDLQYLELWRHPDRSGQCEVRDVWNAIQPQGQWRFKSASLWAATGSTYRPRRHLLQALHTRADAMLRGFATLRRAGATEGEHRGSGSAALLSKAR